MFLVDNYLKVQNVFLKSLADFSEDTFDYITVNLLTWKIEILEDKIHVFVGAPNDFLVYHTVLKKHVSTFSETSVAYTLHVLQN